MSTFDTVACGPHIYRLPDDAQLTRARQWVRENPHDQARFEDAFPDATLVNDRPLGGSTFRP